MVERVERVLEVALGEQDVPSVQEGRGVVRLDAEDQVEPVLRFLQLPAPPVGDRLADQRVHVARLHLQNVVEQVQGLRVVPARARDERAAQQSWYVDADLLDLLPPVVVLRADGRACFVRGQGLWPSSECLDSIPLYL